MKIQHDNDSNDSPINVKIGISFKYAYEKLSTQISNILMKNNELKYKNSEILKLNNKINKISKEK